MLVRLRHLLGWVFSVFRSRDDLVPTILGYLKKPLSMTSEVIDSNFPLSDTADIANDR